MTQYEKTAKRDEFFLITHFYSRRLAYPLARLLARLGVPANAVTVLGGLCWIASVLSALGAGARFHAGCAASGWLLLFVTAALWQLGYVLDVVDGGLARLSSSSSASGFYLDFFFHLFYHPMFLCSVGLFLYLVHGRFWELALAVLAIGCDWGVSFGAKEHVLCELIAKDRHNPMALGAGDRYRIYIDSIRTKTPVEHKRSPVRLVRSLAEEMFCFPGEFTLFSAAVLLDYALRNACPLRFPALTALFVVSVAAKLLRVPFRCRREFRTMQAFDRLNREPPQP